MPIPYEKLTNNDIVHHKYAYDCFDKIGKSLFEEWDILGFEKAVLGCGDNHFLYMAEKIREHKDIFQNLNETMPFLRFGEDGKHYAFELFLSPPPFWGSRGAPFWWAYTARKMTSYVLPMDENELYDLYKQSAKEFGMDVNRDEHYYIERFAAGGMSSGVITGAFIRESWYVIRDRNRLYRKPITIENKLYLDKAIERLSWYCNKYRSDEFEIVDDISDDDFLFAVHDCKGNEHQRDVSLELWGVFTGKPLTMSELAKIKGVTYNAIRLIENRFLQHILTNKNRTSIIRPK